MFVDDAVTNQEKPMTNDEMPRKAADTIKRAGIVDERGVAVVEGMASSRARSSGATAQAVR